MDKEEEKELEEDLVAELESALLTLSNDPETKVHEVQPPHSVVMLAARAAAQVLIAFERGYRME